MLGRTDSRRRLLILLLIFAVGSLALFARTAYWQVLRGDELLSKASAQTTTSVDRDRLVAAADQLAKDPAHRIQTGDQLVRILKLDAPAAAQAMRDKLDSGKPYVVLARGI